MLYVLLQFRAYENYGLLDTGAIQSAMSENKLRRILQAHPAAQLKEYPAPDFKVQTANGSIVPVRKQVLLRFFIGRNVFEETFTILPTMGNFQLGMSFFKKYSVNLDLAKNLVRFPETTLQLKQANSKFKLQMLELGKSQKTTIAPRQQVFIPVVAEKDIGQSRSVPGIRTQDGNTSVLIDVRDTGTTDPCPSHQPPVTCPRHNNPPKHINRSLQITNSGPGQKHTTHDKGANDPDLQIPRRSQQRDPSVVLA